MTDAGTTNVRCETLIEKQIAVYKGLSEIVCLSFFDFQRRFERRYKVCGKCFTNLNVNKIIIFFY